MLGNKAGSACTKELGDNLFKPKYQECLYNVGVTAAKSGSGWSEEPWPNYIIMSK